MMSEREGAEALCCHPGAACSNKTQVMRKFRNALTMIKDNSLFLFFLHTKKRKGPPFQIYHGEEREIRKTLNRRQLWKSNLPVEMKMEGRGGQEGTICGK